MSQAMYEALFTRMHPGFFERPYTQALQAGAIFEEMLLPLENFDPSVFSLPVPEETAFGFYDGPMAPLLDAVGRVGAGWVPLFTPQSRVYCGFYRDQIASFCLVEDMGAQPLGGRTLRIGGPGCVGTVPEFRRQGIGLKMVCDVTEILRREGYDVSYIHFTGVAPWYAKLGYRTCLKWTKDGFLPESQA